VEEDAILEEEVCLHLSISLQAEVQCISFIDLPRGFSFSSFFLMGGFFNFFNFFRSFLVRA
jgi:hypothetical protein